MKNFIKLLGLATGVGALIGLIAFSAGSLLRHGDPAVPKSDPTPVLMSEAHGCRIFSFGDRGETHYFADCKNMVTTEINHDGQKPDVIITRKVK